MKHVCKLIGLIAFACSSAFTVAQTPTGTIEGVVTDNTGAAVQGASITITRTTTNEARDTKSDSAGRYSIPFVEPGNYNISASASGFKIAKQDNVLVQITESRPVNFKLEIGGVTQTVEVNGTTESLDTESSSLGQTIQSQTLLELPDNGRNPFDFATLVPGVSNVGGASTPHIGGSRNANNEQLIDGMTNITPENNIGNNISTYTPVEDSVQEVNVQTSVLAAEYGRFSGGTESLVTKSGGNQWHGSYFEFIQNGALNAAPFGSPGVKSSGSKPDSHQYQSGGTFSGPAIHNKAFFFGDYEYTTQAAGAYESDKVPTDMADFANGDFTSLFGSSTPVLYDPDTVAQNSAGVYVRQPFQVGGQYNVIPASRISPVAKAALSYFPKPNISGAGSANNNYQITQSVPNSYWHFDSREDVDVTSKWHSFLRYSMNGNKSTVISDYNNAASNGGYGGQGHGYVYSGSFNNTVTFSPKLLGEFRYGYSKQTSNRVPAGGSFDPTKLGFDANYAAQASKQLEIFPHFSFGGANNGSFSDLGPLGYEGLQEDPMAQSINGSLVKIAGGHTLKFGGEFRSLRLNFFQYTYPSGTFSSDDSWTRQFPQTFDGTSGFSIASLMLGLPQSGSISNDPKYITTSQYFALYGQDDWKVTPKFTLNYGLRWDVEVPREEQNNQMVFWDPTAPSPLQAYSSQIASSLSGAGESCPACGKLLGSMTIVGAAGARYGRRQAPIQKNDFGPRLGFAYNPVPKIAIRGGAGIVFQPSALQASGTSGGSGDDGFDVTSNYQPSFNNQTSLPVATLYSPDPMLSSSAQNPFPSGYAVAQGRTPSCLSSPACVQGIDIGSGMSTAYFDSYRNPYSIQWNANVQFQAVWGIKMEVGYLANRGLFLVNGDPGKPFDQLSTDQLTANGCTIGASTAQCKLSQQVANPFQTVIGPGSPFYVPGLGLGGGTVSAGQLLHRYPQYQGVNSFRKPDSDSMYNGFTFRADKSMQQGLSFIFSFTDGREYDNGASAVTYLGATSGTYADQYNPRAEWSKGAQNVDYQIAGAFVYELPIGRGKMFLNSGLGAADKIINGWQLSGIENWSTGTPIVIGSVDNGTTQETYGSFSQRPHWTGTSPKLNDKSYHLWFNPNDYSVPLPYEIGNSPRTIGVNNPDYQNLDLQIAKNTYLSESERYRVQLRLEMFNAFNHPSLGNPNTGVTSGTFGQIQSFSGTARRLQVAAKFSF
jgi:Carboxypeptidase regulatory-like domain/TonB dependent receptor